MGFEPDIHTDADTCGQKQTDKCHGVGAGESGKGDHIKNVPDQKRDKPQQEHAFSGQGQKNITAQTENKTDDNEQGEV